MHGLSSGVPRRARICGLRTVVLAGAAAALVSLAGVCASLTPARRAAAVEPLVARHHE